MEFVSQQNNRDHNNREKWTIMIVWEKNIKYTRCGNLSSTEMQFSYPNFLPSFHHSCEYGSCGFIFIVGDITELIEVSIFIGPVRLQIEFAMLGSCRWSFLLHFQHEWFHGWRSSEIIKVLKMVKRGKAKITHRFASFASNTAHPEHRRSSTFNFISVPSLSYSGLPIRSRPMLWYLEMNAEDY